MTNRDNLHYERMDGLIGPPIKIEDTMESIKIVGDELYLFLDAWDDRGAESIKFFGNSKLDLKIKIAEYVLKNKIETDYFSICKLDTVKGTVEVISVDDFLDM